MLTTTFPATCHGLFRLWLKPVTFPHCKEQPPCCPLIMSAGPSTENLNAFDVKECCTLCPICNGMVDSGDVHAFIECGMLQQVFMCHLYHWIMDQDIWFVQSAWQIRVLPSAQGLGVRAWRYVALVSWHDLQNKHKGCVSQQYHLIFNMLSRRRLSSLMYFCM